jgi:chromosome partitioning protein
MPKIILITHQKGGVGKSTLCFNLAQNISKNAKVAVIDFDLQGSLSQLSEMVVDFDIISYEENKIDITKLEYDFIFLDTPPYLSNYLDELIKLSDLIIVPTKAGILDLLAVKNTIELIEESDCKDKILIVFNMIKANTTLTLDILIEMEEYNVNIAKTHVSDLVAFTRSVVMQGVVQDKNAQKQIDNLSREVLTKLI